MASCNKTVGVEFLVADSEAQALLQRVELEGIRLIYATTTANFGTIANDEEDAQSAPEQAAQR